jgi:anti-sigma B factor antagonist
MTANTRKIDGVSIVDLAGRITIGEGTIFLKDAVRNLLQRNEKRIVLNLADVSYIDSSGIGELVSSFTTVGNQGGKLKLLNLTKKVHDLLSITKLLTVFEVFSDEAEAIQSF